MSQAESITVRPHGSSKKQKTDELTPSSIAQEVLLALAPTLEAMQEKIMANVNLANSKLHESLLEKIAEINIELAKSQAKITTLENQITQVRNAQKGAALPVAAPPNHNMKNTTPQTTYKKSGENSNTRQKTGQLQQLPAKPTKPKTERNNNISEKPKIQPVIPKPFPVSER